MGTAMTQRRMAMLAIHFDALPKGWLPLYDITYCSRGSQMWQIARSEQAGIVMIKCERESDFDIVRELRTNNNRLPIVVVGDESLKDNAVRIRCAFVSSDATEAKFNEAAAHAFNMAA